MVATKRSQHTLRFSETIRMIGYALGGEAGCRLAVRLGIPISPDTVLRKIDRNDLAAIKEPKVMGVDDWGLAQRPQIRFDTRRLGDAEAD